MDTIELPALRRAIETRDGTTLAGFYRDDALLRIVDQQHPPGNPMELRGRDSIAAYYAEMCGRAMTHSVDTALADGECIAFTQTCTYPDGKRVYCAATLELAHGKIARQVSIQAWDP